MFPGHLMSLSGDSGWPARSPDLNPSAFFSLGISQVKGNHPQSIEQLKNAIRQKISVILHEMTHRVIDNFCERLQKCLD